MARASNPSVKRVPQPASAPEPTGSRATPTPAPAATWTFLSNHSHVLLLIARDPEIRLREVAELVGITERAVQRIVADLEEGQYLERERNGRRNRYKVHRNLPLRHPVEAHRDVGSLLSLILDHQPE